RVPVDFAALESVHSPAPIRGIPLASGGITEVAFLPQQLCPSRADRAVNFLCAGRWSPIDRRVRRPGLQKCTEVVVPAYPIRRSKFVGERVAKGFPAKLQPALEDSAVNNVRPDLRVPGNHATLEFLRTAQTVKSRFFIRDWTAQPVFGAILHPFISDSAIRLVEAKARKARIKQAIRRPSTWIADSAPRGQIGDNRLNGGRAGIAVRFQILCDHAGDMRRRLAGSRIGGSRRVAAHSSGGDIYARGEEVHNRTVVGKRSSRIGRSRGADGDGLGHPRRRGITGVLI